MDVHGAWLRMSLQQPAEVASAVNHDVLAVGIISGVVAIIVAWINRPNRQQQAASKEILENTRKTGNGWTEHLGDRLDRMETSLEARLDLTALQTQQQLDELKVNVARLEGRFDEHMRTQVPQPRIAEEETR